jgi:hypothetical protein
LIRPRDYLLQGAAAEGYEVGVVVVGSSAWYFPRREKVEAVRWSLGEGEHRTASLVAESIGKGTFELARQWESDKVGAEDRKERMMG